MESSKDTVYPKVGEYMNGKKVLRVVPIRAFLAFVENETGGTDELIGFEDIDGALNQKVVQKQSVLPQGDEK